MSTNKSRLEAQLGNVGDTLAAHTEEVEELRAAVDSLEEAANADPVEYATVLITKPGKASVNLQLPAGSSVRDFMAEAGWDCQGHSFQLSAEGGYGNTEVKPDFNIETGIWSLFAAPRVAGGL